MINYLCLIILVELDFVIEKSAKSFDILCAEWLNFQMILFILDHCDHLFEHLSNDDIVTYRIPYGKI